jgi:putative hemolysin
MITSENARRFLLVAGSVILALSLLEVLALSRILDYRRMIGPPDPFSGTDIGDKELLHIRPPYCHFSGVLHGGNISEVAGGIPPSDMTLFRWDVKYDRNGFRNGVDLTGADTIVLGDSMVEAISVPDAQLMTSLLARLQGRVVANLGQYGYGPLEEQVVLKRYGLPLRPRTVLWMFYEGNDLRDVIRYRKEMMAQREQPGFWRPYWQRSFTYNALEQIHMQLKKAFRPSGIRRSGVMQTSNAKKLTVYFTYPSLPLTKEDLSALDEAALTVAAAHKLCAAQGSRLVFVFIPEKFRVFQGLCQFPHESECRNWALNDMPERLQRTVRSISPEIGYLDLTPDFVAAARRGVVSYYPDDTHWSAEGHKIAAESINDYLLSEQSR